MRILSLYYTHKPGGFCKRLYRLLNALASKGHEVHYITLDNPGDRLSPEIQLHLMPFPLKWRRGLWFWLIYTIWTPFYLLKLTRELSPDRFALFGAYYSAASALARKREKVPGVLFLRSLVFKINQINDVALPMLLASNAIDWIGIKSIEKVVVMTNAMKDELQEFLGTLPAKIEVLPNDLPNISITREAKNPVSTPLTIVASGVIDARKNLDVLLSAARIVQSQQGATACRFVIAGDGPLLEQLKSRCQIEEISNVEFLGWLEDPVEILRKADLFIHPSLHEGVSNSLLEALSLGVPVLAADTLEQREILKRPELLFEPNDSKALASKIGALVQDPSKLTKLKIFSIDAAVPLKFDWDSLATKLVCEG